MRTAGGREMKLTQLNTANGPRNQRVSNPRQRKQQHLLDVKVRSRKATQHRNRRILVFISKIVLVARDLRRSLLRSARMARSGSFSKIRITA